MEAKTEQEVIDILNEKVAEFGSQRALAKHLFISEMHLSDILRGNRGVSESVANALGYKIKKIYIPLEEK